MIEKDGKSLFFKARLEDDEKRITIAGLGVQEAR
jgi:hypothetical protein